MDAMEMDKDDLEEVEAAANFVENAGVFHKAPATKSAPPAEAIPPQTSDTSISKATFDKLVADVAEVKANVVEVKADVPEVKANQLEIKSKLDLLLQILSQNEDKKEEHGASSTTDEASSPLPAPKTQVVVYQSPPTPSVKIMQDVEVEKGNFKWRKRPNTKLADFTNPSSKKFKVNDPCEIDPLRPIDNEQLKNFMKWLDGKIENKKHIDVKTCDEDVN